MNGLAQVGSWQVSSELSAHCASQPQVCEDLSASVGRALMSGLLIHGALIGGAELAVVPQIFVRMWTLASSKLPQILARTPTTALTCFATLLASGSSLVTAQHTESAIANMLDELGTALATLWAELFTSFFSSLATVLNWWLVADWIVLLYGCVQYLRGVRRDREPEAFRAARAARDRVGHREAVKQQPVEAEDACAICLEICLETCRPAELEHCKFGCGKACHRRCLRQWLKFSEKCPNCTTLWQRPHE